MGPNLRDSHYDINGVCTVLKAKVIDSVFIFLFEVAFNKLVEMNSQTFIEV